MNTCIQKAREILNTEESLNELSKSCGLPTHSIKDKINAYLDRQEKYPYADDDVGLVIRNMITACFQ